MSESDKELIEQLYNRIYLTPEELERAEEILEELQDNIVYIKDRS